jgi:hypothetical protein
MHPGAGLRVGKTPLDDHAPHLGGLRHLIVAVVPKFRDSRSARAHLAGSAPQTDRPQSAAPPSAEPHSEAPGAAGPAPKSFPVSIRSRMAARLTLAAGVGLAVGAATEWSVPHLPFFLEPLGNTAAPWILVAGAVALTAQRIGESLMLAVITLVALVLGFYVAEAYRGWPVSRHQVEFWSAASVVVGPLVGLAAAWLRHARHTTAALGAGVLGGLLAGEAVYGLTKLKFSSPAHYWHVQLTLGVGLAVGLTLWRSRRHLLSSLPSLAVSLATCTMVGLGTLAVYQVP